MKLQIFAPLLALGSTVLGLGWTPTQEADAAKQIDAMAEKALNATLALLDSDVAAAKAAGLKPNCTREKLEYRVEFGSMAKNDRKAYTTAVLCLQSKPPNTPVSVSAGARSRFDDFVVTHIYQTPYVHNSGTFLGWHRWYLWVYEQALRTECNYTGPIPYWDWSKYAASPQTSVVFNGDEYSMGGNGKAVANHAGAMGGFIPAGLGGGCIESGPFKNMSVNLGPIGLQPVGPSNGLGYNPRCLKRDIGPTVSTQNTNYTSVLAVMNMKTIATFQDLVQSGGSAPNGPLGIHGGGHYTISGDPGGDFYVSPGDPGFYLHHGQIDRLWTIWQMQNSTRQYAIAGTNTMNNYPPSADTQLTDVMNAGYAGGPNITVRDSLSTVRGSFCFVYARSPLS